MLQRVCRSSSFGGIHGKLQNLTPKIRRIKGVGFITCEWKLSSEEGSSQSWLLPAKVCSIILWLLSDDLQVQDKLSMFSKIWQDQSFKQLCLEATHAKCWFIHSSWNYSSVRCSWICAFPVVMIGKFAVSSINRAYYSSNSWNTDLFVRAETIHASVFLRRVRHLSSLFGYLQPPLSLEYTLSTFRKN